MLTNKCHLTIAFALLFQPIITSDYFAPATLINVFIFMEKTTLNKVLHIFFLRTTLSYSDRSLQYFFIDNLIFTHTHISLKSGGKFPLTTLELGPILSKLIQHKAKMLKLTEIASIQIKPFVYTLSSTEETPTELLPNLASLEESCVNRMFTGYNTKQSSFALFGDHFSFDEKLKMPMSKLSKRSNKIEFYLEKVTTHKVDEGENVEKITPYAFSMLDEKQNVFLNEAEKFTNFNFANYGKGWEVVAPRINDKGTLEVDKTNLEDVEQGPLIVDCLNKIFTVNKTLKSSSTTNFVQNGFLKFLLSLTDNEKELEEELHKVFDVKQSDTFVTVEDVNGELINKDKKERKYSVHGVLKESFEMNELKTNAQPFSNGKQIDTVSTSKSNSQSSSTEISTNSDTTTSSTSTQSERSSSVASKEKMTPAQILFVVVLVLVPLSGIAGVIWYYFFRLNGKIKKKRINM
eukprot:GAHX01001657.1.p1 GENE.GAHX01001657.1~~GAHX01001657.1.p1  ORF type:complete len:462 (+),score=83.75 GAHX01001657.1:23-1408(+)